MATIQKTVSEAIGVKERKLNSHHTETDGNEQYITRHLSSIWDEESAISTDWERTEQLQKDE